MASVSGLHDVDSAIMLMLKHLQAFCKLFCLLALTLIRPCENSLVSATTLACFLSLEAPTTYLQPFYTEHFDNR